MSLAEAVVPNGYTLNGTLINGMQNNNVPFRTRVKAVDSKKEIYLFAESAECFSELRSPLLKMASKMDPTFVASAERKYTEPEEYIRQYAQSLTGAELTPTDRAKLPSWFGNNLQKYYDNMMSEYQSLFDVDAQLGTYVGIESASCDALLFRYTCTLSGRDCVVLAGADLMGIGFYNKATAAGQQALGSLKNMFSRQGGSDDTAAEAPLGHGKLSEKIDWGCNAKYAVVAPLSREREAANAFIQFVGTYHMDPALQERFNELKMQRREHNLQETFRMHNMAQQAQMRLRQSQQQLQQTLARNSREISAGIMDSWEKRSASQSRMSQNWSEAIRGVDTYTTPAGTTVEASVSADHVYQDRYGDIYEVHGPDIEQSMANDLDWTKLNKNE